MKSVYFITIFVVQLCILLTSICGMTVADLCMTYDHITPISYDVAEKIYLISGIFVVCALIGIVNLLLAGVIVYHCFGKKYSWLYSMMKNEMKNDSGYCEKTTNQPTPTAQP